MTDLKGYTHRPVRGHEGVYSVTSCGKVYSHFKEAFMSLRRHKANGYLRLNLRLNGVRKTIEVHRLVADAFIPKPVGCNTVNHLNEIKTDNRVSNLEWTTNAENTLYSIGKRRSITRPTGETDAFVNVSAYCRANGLSPKALQKMARGVQHSHKGFTNYKTLN